VTRAREFVGLRADTPTRKRRSIWNADIEYQIGVRVVWASLPAAASSPLPPFHLSRGPAPPFARGATDTGMSMPIEA